MRSAGWLLGTIGVALLAWSAWMLWGTTAVAVHTQHQVVTQVRHHWASRQASGGEQRLPGGVLGLLLIPRFGHDYVRPIVSGTDAEALKQGVGHYRFTPTLGEEGNVGLAGHRTTYGAPLHDIAELRLGDRVQVRTYAATYTYLVHSIEVVDPQDTTVLAPRAGHWLTLTTCTPMYWAIQRYVVQARLAHTTRITHHSSLTEGKTS